MEQELMTRMRLLNVAMVRIGNSPFVVLGEDVLPERINKKGTLNGDSDVDLLSPERGSLRKSVTKCNITLTSLPATIAAIKSNGIQIAKMQESQITCGIKHLQNH
jgi:hypothetical protein